MKRVIYILGLCFMIIVIGACELVVDIDVPFEGKQLTINSFFSPDSIWSATVSRNRFILDDDLFDRVSDAFVVVSDETGPVDTLEHTFNGHYRSNGKPLPGKMYTISAFHPSNGTALGHSQVPPPTQIVDAGHENIMVENQQRTNFNVTFLDDPAATNYYEVFVLVGSESINPVTKELYKYFYPIHLETNDPVLANSNIRSGERFLLKDVFYGGSEINLSFHTQWWIDHVAAIHIIVRSVTEEYYKYMTTTNLQGETSGNPFAQPVNVYGNIENGFGIFAGINNTSKIITSPSFEIVDVTPGQGRHGDEVTITLNGITLLPPDQMYITAVFEASEFLAYTYVSERTANTVTFTIPNGAITGKLWLEINGRIQQWDQEFIVLP